MKKITTKPDGTTETLEGTPWELWQYDQFRLGSVGTINPQPVIIPTIPIEPCPWIDPLTPLWYKGSTGANKTTYVSDKAGSPWLQC